MSITEVPLGITEVPTTPKTVVSPTLEHEAKLALFTWSLWCVDMTVATEGRYEFSDIIKGGTVLTSSLLQIFIDAYDYDRPAEDVDIINAIGSAVEIIGAFDPEMANELTHPSRLVRKLMMAMGLDEFFWLTSVAGFDTVMSYQRFMLTIDMLYGLGMDRGFLLDWANVDQVKQRYIGALPATATPRRFREYHNGNNRAEWMSIWYHINATIAPPTRVAHIPSIIHPKGMTWMIISFMNLCIGRGIPAPQIDTVTAASALGNFYERIYPAAQRNGNEHEFDKIIRRIKKELVS